VAKNINANGTERTTDMKKILGATVALAVMAIFVSLANATITIKVAEVQNGVAVVQGSKAVPTADIFWEGVKVTQANTGGNFSFSGVVPADCTGTLSDGTPIEVILLDCTPVSPALAPVAKTGQTECYNEHAVVISCTGTGQDGELQKGVASPSPRFIAGGDKNGNSTCTDAGETCDGTMTDTLTGLIWLRNANCIASSSAATDGTLQWEEALVFIAEINSGTYDCGDTSNGGNHESDWRLPNIRELASLVDYGRINPALPPSHLFLNLQVGLFYWSSTTSRNFAVIAWGLSTGDDDVSFSNKGFTHRVFAVRGGS
jgi:hypothetical protein